MTERLLSVGEVDLCVETFGSPSDPTILLIHGACASMLWWPQAFCAAFAGPSPFFDAVATRRLAAADVARTVCLEAALTNHFAMRIDGPRAAGPPTSRCPRSSCTATSIPCTRCRTGRPSPTRYPARPCWCSPTPATTSHRSTSGSSSMRSSPTPAEEHPLNTSTLPVVAGSSSEARTAADLSDG